jgi:hypothetical protein
MLKNKNKFEIINLFFHCQAENFSDHPRTLCMGMRSQSLKMCVVLWVQIAWGWESKLSLKNRQTNK